MARSGPPRFAPFPMAPENFGDSFSPTDLPVHRPSVGRSSDGKRCQMQMSSPWLSGSAWKKSAVGKSPTPPSPPTSRALHLTQERIIPKRPQYSIMQRVDESDGD